ncbi:glutathione-disulfide reductase [Haliangium ochraceum]|uniref:Glutathione reductase n=1 Tax=Haliangium ochraceum (strain DSM 14365 / JCM 11303 / SMP-2) TaxID=502025 RepID=D0LH58_HALO1|nr:glutathione-disulfide reductase [Haliangium ochraceum]ACY18203.1 glutathione-disulfide reductase [Haliangium ochraceum DSM 14365]
MSTYDYDLFVIGGGSGGVRAARIAAQHGARVAIAEEHRYGGTCVIRGCVPKKLFVYASEFGHAIEDSAAFGWQSSAPSFDWATLIANKDREIDRLNGIYERLLGNSKVTLHHGRATLVDAHTVEVEGQRHSTRVILVATGSRPRRMEMPGAEHVITSDEAFYLPELPQRVLVVGGGYIAIEFAHIFRGLGAEVSLIHRGDKLLGGFDDDIRTEVTTGAMARGIDLHLEDEVAAVEKRADGSLVATLRSGTVIDAGVVMAAIGRIPNTDKMGLEHAGVQLRENGAVHVDRYSHTGAESIYAVGDCTDRVNLTPVAIREGQAFADMVFGEHTVELDYEHIPTAVFSQPPVGTVGLSEAEARAQLASVDIYMSRFRPMKYTLPGRDEHVMMKLVVDGETQRVVGVHMVGIEAAELVQCLAISVRMGATKDDFDATLAVHPTTAEELVLMRNKVR